MHYNYHRYYSPELGRYVTRDPIGLAGGINPHVFAAANPIINGDPDGKVVITVPVAVATGLAAAGAACVATKCLAPVAEAIVDTAEAVYDAAKDIGDAISDWWNDDDPVPPPTMPAEEVNPTPTPWDDAKDDVTEDATDWTPSDFQECEANCDFEWERNQEMCKVDAAMRGYDPGRYRQCMDRVDEIYIECLQECKQYEC